jgi:hypothetical protein
MKTEARIAITFLSFLLVMIGIAHLAQGFYVSSSETLSVLPGVPPTVSYQLGLCEFEPQTGLWLGIVAASLTFLWSQRYKANWDSTRGKMTGPDAA